MKRPARRAHELLLERLLARAPELADDLADAVVRAAPEQYRARIELDCRPVTHLLITEALNCLRDGASLSPEALAAVDAGARENRSAGVPPTVTVRAMGAALTRFVGAVRTEAETLPHPRAQVIAAIATLTARAPIVVFEIITAFVAGHGPGATSAAASAAEQDSLHPTAAEVLRLTAGGLTARAVAVELGCTTSNVTYHLAQLRRRFGVSTTTALVVRARQHLPAEPPASWPTAEEQVTPASL